MERYNIIEKKNPREIVLLKSRPCGWGRCLFCDYIHDNSENEEEMIELNRCVLKQVTGFFSSLEVINSASVFELPKQTLEDIRMVCDQKKIKRLSFESYYNYRHRLSEIHAYFSHQQVVFKCGVETFDDDFRNRYLRKNIQIGSYEQMAKDFETICLMVGIQGQTKEMIDRDMCILQKYFRRGCINIFVENSTSVKRDEELIRWFREKYSDLENQSTIEILWNNTDFGVGE